MGYEFCSRVRYSEVDQNRTLTMSSLIDYFQDCSTFQSEDCGNGIGLLSGRHQAWMIVSWQIEIERLPVLGEKIVSRTFPYAFKAFYGYRNYALLDEKGNDLARANSVWVLMDVENGKPVKVGEDIIGKYELEPQLEMKIPAQRKIRMPEQGDVKDSFQVSRSDLDTNHHVNNGRYIRMAEEFLPSDFRPVSVQVEYRNQARLHDVIVPALWCSEDRTEVIVSLCNDKMSPYAVIKYTGETDRQ